MRNAAIGLLTFSLGVCGSVGQSHAELKLQSDMAAACKPAVPSTVTVVKWKRTCPAGDCFVWRLSCANGKSYQMESKKHPATTEWQDLFYEWSPWSIFLYLLPLALYAGLATIGSGGTALFVILNILFLSYFLCAAWALCANITGNPWGAWAEHENLLLLNPYLFGAVLIGFAFTNLAMARRGLEFFFFQHPVSAENAPALMRAHPAQATSVSMSLMPDLSQFVDPAETAMFYRRETERLNALRERLNAQTALAEAAIRHRRARNQYQDQE